MATSLVSTGVQFPDATIQTTAAASPPGATSQYSVVGRAISGVGITQSFTISSLAAGTVYANSSNGLYGSGAGSQRVIYSPFWSKYYSSWFCLMESTSASVYGLFKSTDGIDWVLIVANIANATGLTISTAGLAGMAVITVDDSNGRFFIMGKESSQIVISYSSLTSSQALNGNWTRSVTFTPTTNSVGGLMYCKMATTATSGIVAHWIDTSIPAIYISTISAGSTTNVDRMSMGLSGSSGSWMSYEENGKIFAPAADRSTNGWNFSGDIRTGWNSSNGISVFPTDQRQTCVGNGYLVYINGSSIYSSTTASGWTATSVGGSNLNGVIYTGSVWVAWDTTGTSYVSATNVPTSTWSLYAGGSINAGRYIGMQSAAWGRRVVA